MPNIFDLTKIKKLVDEKHVSVIILVDTNIVIRESDFMTWKTSIKEPIFILSDVIIHELEQVRKKPNSEGAEKAIRSISKLFQRGSITNGIHIEDIGWFIGIPSYKEEELRLELSKLEGDVKAFGSSDIKLLLLAKECSQVITGAHTIFATGDINLFNIVEIRDIPGYLFTNFPIMTFEEVMNKHLMKTTNWDNVLADIQKTNEIINSFHWFCEEGLVKLLMNKVPIQNRRKSIELNFIAFEWREPTHTAGDCQELGLTWDCPLYAKTRV